MGSGLLRYGTSEIHYLELGTGDTIIVALHGYGEDAGSFECLQTHLGDQFRVIAIDLPYHGSTSWKEARAFTDSDLALVVDGIFKELNIPAKPFMVMGYSMGGRLALSLTEHLRGRISRLLLLAPDGMKVNFWYWLATQTKQGNKLFLSTMKNPKWFFMMLRIADRFKLINKSIYKFIHNYIDDPGVRDELYHRWVCMRTFKPDLMKLRSIIQDEKLPVRLLYGKHDRIILPTPAMRFCKGLEDHCQLNIINCGHQVLQKTHAPVIIKLLTT